VGRAARLTAAAGAALVAAVGPARRAEGQRARPDPSGAVRLELHPRVGDTVRTRFEQTVQLFARDADGGERGAGMASSMTVLGRSVVERVEAAGAVIVAVTDSVALRASGAPARATEAARRGMQGRRSRVRVAPDGATAVLGPAAGQPRPDAGPPPLRFPATFPAGLVAPGAMWSRAITVPWGGVRGGGAAAGSTIDVWFRFDSLARGGAVAHLSLRGTVHSAGAGGRAAPASAGDAGSGVAGALVVDRARGWVVDSRMTFQLDGVIATPGGAPRPARVVVTQRLRVL
jgi:hypothetical protein